MTDPESQDRAYELGREEYTQLKAEQRDRMKTRNTVAVGWVSVLLLIASQVRNTPALLLAVAPVGAVSCWWWLAENVKITEIRRYISDDLRPRMEAFTGDRHVFRWEVFHLEQRSRRWVKTLDLIFTAMLFAAGGVAADLGYVLTTPNRPATHTIALAVNTILAGVILAELVRAADIPARKTR